MVLDVAPGSSPFHKNKQEGLVKYSDFTPPCLPEDRFSTFRAASGFFKVFRYAMKCITNVQYVRKMVSFRSELTLGVNCAVY